MFSKKQIFQTNNTSRWQRVKWGSRILFLFFVLLLIILFVALLRSSKDKPNISVGEHALHIVLTEKVNPYAQSTLAKKYQSFRKYFQEKDRQRRNNKTSNTVNKFSQLLGNDSLGIRAAFFVNWDNQSYTSLAKNISKINLVLPEWFFIDPIADTLEVKLDYRALASIKSNKVAIMPMLSNNHNKVFSGDAVHRILNNPIKREKFITAIVNALEKNKFTGINVDFEELNEPNNEVLNNFLKELYTVLHQRGLLVTQNVSPFNEDYDYKTLAKYNDFIFLMAYDEHNESTKPGAISSQKWVEKAVTDLLQFVPSEKIVLNFAGYGYDWDADNNVNNVTYQQAITKANESETPLIFNDDTYNLNFSYLDDENKIHSIYFTDAVTNFNILRFASEAQLAGTALWRLGSEDNRLWQFYDKPFNQNSIKNFDFSLLENIPSTTVSDFIGEGEILDMVSSPTSGKVNIEFDKNDVLISNETYSKLPSGYVIRKYGKTSQKKLVLTFDDGPDATYTPQILDTLSHYHVPAAFFVVGIEAEKNLGILKRIFKEGHEIGNHTFTHPNIANVSNKRAYLEMDLTRLLIECATGHSTILFRAPYNADSDPEKYDEMHPVDLSRNRNYLTVGEAIDPEDWEKGERPDFNSDTIYNRVLKIYNTHIQNDDSVNIILLHDAGGDRSETVLAVGKIIRHYQSLGYQFTTIADLLHKKPNDVMPEVPKGSGYYLLQFNTLLFTLGYLINHFLFGFFLLFMILSALRLLFVLTIAIKQKRKEQKTLLPILTTFPKVSVIVPGYNESINIVKCVHNLLESDYPNFDIVFVDDGSKDDSVSLMNEAFLHHPKVYINTKPNGGKASALNFGLQKTDANYVVCIDADTRLQKNAISLLLNNFLENEKVAAVAGVVKVGNRKNMLTQFQSIEYITGQNFDRRCFTYLNAITVVPGAIGAFKKDLLFEVGGFTTDTLAEDCDITIRLLRAGYIVTNNNDAIAYTEVPETVNQFMKQRFRWTFGVMQTFWKNKQAFLNKNQKGLGYFAFPDMLIFKYFLPIFTPLADVLMFIGLVTGNATKILLFYTLFLVIDAIIAATALIFAKEKLYQLLWLIPQRLVYRWLMMIVLFRALKRAIKGELQSWGILKRTGNVKVQ